MDALGREKAEAAEELETLRERMRKQGKLMDTLGREKAEAVGKVDDLNWQIKELRKFREV